MAELFGRAGGVSRGRGGSMHLFDIAKRFMGGYAIVAGHMPARLRHSRSPQQYRAPIASRSASSATALSTKAPSTSRLNIAAVWKLPVLFICENNYYGMGTAAVRVSATSEVAKRAEAYGIRAEQVDGMDVLAVHEAHATGAPSSFAAAKDPTSWRR